LLYDSNSASMTVDHGPRIIYSRQEHSSLSNSASAPRKGRGKVRQSYDEEKVLVFLDNPAGILVPDILYSGDSPMIIASNLDLFQI
jgi:hypothetical protein